jgi:hypothetical protein
MALFAEGHDRNRALGVMGAVSGSGRPGLIPESHGHLGRRRFDLAGPRPSPRA